MKIASIRFFPDPILRKKSETVKNFDENLKVLLTLLEKTMRAQPSGIGIAAPQIGIAKRIAVVDVSSRDPRGGLLYLINPEILEQSDPRASREGCMSLPDYTAHLMRFNRIRMKWQDETGAFREMTAAGIEAICIQHEIDHLNGLLFFDRVASLKTDMLPRKPSR